MLRQGTECDKIFSMLLAPIKLCPLCDQKWQPYIEKWLFRCRACGLQHSILKHDLDHKKNLDEYARIDALHELRKNNFNKVLRLLESILGKSRGRLLDVGSGHGWFLKQAKDKGYEVLGVEPDSEMTKFTLDSGLPVRLGIFPDALKENENFDIITFNDVFEHLPNVEQALQDVRRHLSPRGLLMINLPSSSGFIFQIASILAKLGFPGGLNRMWQMGLPSPHLWYFNRKQLATLAHQQGFRLLKSETLNTISLYGLWNRLTFDRSMSKLKASIIYVGIITLYPFFRLLPSDIIVEIYQKN